MIVTLAGHVDHGKTSLVEALTGVNTDTLAEEQRRGLTIDLGFSYTDIAGQRIGFVDVPGHHRFIHNMVAGVAAHQHALLVVAADDGPMPQTLEHLAILRLLGVDPRRRGGDQVDWVEPRSSRRRPQSPSQPGARRRLATSADSLATSCVDGTGLDELRASHRSRRQSRRRRSGWTRSSGSPSIGPSSSTGSASSSPAPFTPA